MLYHKLLTVTALLAPLAFAGIIPIHHTSRACAYSCGSNCYTKSAVSAAQDVGYELYSASDDVNNYPHEYHNYEDFDFPVPGEYYEFPILGSGDIYSGGSPGADRVVFNAEDQLAGVITHSGASGNAFVACTS